MGKTKLEVLADQIMVDIRKGLRAKPKKITNEMLAQKIDTMIKLMRDF